MRKNYLKLFVIHSKTDNTDATLSVTVIVVRNEIGDPNLKPGRGCLCFTSQ